MSEPNNIFTAGTTGSGMTPEVTKLKQNMITITPATAKSTYNIVPTTQNNQSVIQRLGSTTDTTGSVMATEMTTAKHNMITIAPEISTQNVLSTTPNNQTVIKRLESTTVPLTVSIDDGETMYRQLGSNATITCSASGVGNITVAWIGPSKNKLTNNEKYYATVYNISTGKSTLTIYAISTPDAGSYICLAMAGSSSAYDTIILKVTEGTPGAGITSGMGTSKQHIITTTPGILTAADNRMPTIPSNQTITQRLESPTTPDKSSATPTMKTTIPNNQTVIQRLASTTTPDKSSATPNMTPKIPSNQTVIQRLVPTTGETMPEVTSVQYNVTVPAPLISNSTQDMTASALANTSSSLRGFDATTATTPQNIPAAEQISKTSMNSTTPLPIGTTKQETISTSGIREQSDNCCLQENMVLMLQHNVPIVNGYVPFVSLLEQTNGTDIAACDAKVLLKATFRRSNQTSPCESCTNFPRCGNQMLKIDLWMSPNKHGVSFHAGDSITNDGYGGDNNTQDNDAEFYMYNYEQRLYGSDKCSNMSQLLFSLPNNSAHWVTIYIGNEFIRVSTPLGDAFELCSNCLFALNGQADSQGTVNEDIYVGLNRIISSSQVGNGSGVCGVVISWACPWKI
ncbi:hypothetical protein ACJMK2_024676 [Sinanodonta woodiana]|uniref:Ig-like domain-containing protein n=1 Tax=Sinanodonta woodiana TaxID=1069815 RepID=A0ABD3XHP8_SINWO